MQVYVAGRTKNIDEVHVIQEVLLDHGHSITHDWTDVEGEGKGEIRDDWSEDPKRARQVATLDFLGVTKARGVIVCGYGCDEGEGGLGMFIEVGLAMASGIPIVIVGPMRESVFWYAPYVSRVEPNRQPIKTEAEVAVKMLEQMRRQADLALNDSDTTVNVQP